jgi:hypothetical protein
MHLSNRFGPTRRYAVGALSAAIILLTPAVASVLLIVAEALVDLLLVGGTGAALAIAAGVIGLSLSRKRWRRALNFGVVRGGFRRIAHV